MQSTGCIRQYRVPTILVMVARDVRFASKCGKSNTKNKKNHRVTRKSKLKNWLNHRVTRKSKQKIWLNRLFIIPLQPQIRKTLWRAQVKWCVNKAVMCWSAKPNRAVRLRYAPLQQSRKAQAERTFRDLFLATAISLVKECYVFNCRNKQTTQRCVT